MKRIIEKAVEGDYAECVVCKKPCAIEFCSPECQKIWEKGVNDLMAGYDMDWKNVV